MPKVTFSGRGGILTWVKLISSYLFTLLAIHQLQGKSNYMCPTHLVWLLGDSDKMRECFVNTDALFLCLLVPGQLPAALLSTQFLPTPPPLPDFHPPTPVWTPPCTSAASTPETAAHAAPGQWYIPAFLQGSSSPAPALLGSLGMQPAGWGRVCGKSEEMFSLLGKKARLQFAGVL